MHYLQRRWNSANRGRRLAVALGGAALLVVGYLAVSQVTRSPAPGSAASVTAIGFSQVSRPAPAIDLPWLTGSGSVRLSQLAGRPIVLNFWSSSCEICRQESPAIAKVARAAGDHVAFLGIDTLDLRGPALAFLRHYGIYYRVADDAQGMAAARYGVPGLPVTFFLSATGKQIVGVNAGALSAPALTRILRKLYGVSV